MQLIIPVLSYTSASADWFLLGLRNSCMSREGQTAEALASVTTSNNILNHDELAARVALNNVDCAVHQALDAFDGDSNENLRALLVPAHLPIIIGSVIKVRDDRCFCVAKRPLTFVAGK
jgi:hypothetical protein